MFPTKQGVELVYRKLSRCFREAPCRHSSNGKHLAGSQKPHSTNASRSNIQKEKSERIVSNVGTERELRVPLDVPLPGMLTPQIAKTKFGQMMYETKVTTLGNGLRVASQARPGAYCTIGVVIKSGSRFEKSFTKGVSQIVEKLGFSSSTAYPDKTMMSKEFENFGAIADTQTSRDTTVYVVSTPVNGLPKMMEVLGEAVLRPRILEEEVIRARETILYQLQDLQMQPDKESVILEMIHEASWKDNTLGYSGICREEDVATIGREEILRYMKTFYTPSRLVVSGVGVDHEEFIDLTKEYLNVENSTWNSEDVAGIVVDDSKSVYTGGELRVQQDFTQFNAGPLPVPKLAHMAIGLQSVPHLDPLFIPACVLNIMMGGGGSFSAGGPGKGIYSRLYTNVLNLNHWVYNTTAYNNSYTDGGMFCIYGCAPPGNMKSLTDSIIQELYKMAAPIDAEELERGKRKLQSMLLMNLESRPVLFEDIGRQMLAHGHYKTPSEYLQLIDNVTENDVRALAHQMLQTKPSLAALGLLDHLPQYNEIVTSGANGECLKKPSIRFFRL